MTMMTTRPAVKLNGAFDLQGLRMRLGNANEVDFGTGAVPETIEVHEKQARSHIADA
jgi:hypothetical protein